MPNRPVIVEPFRRFPGVLEVIGIGAVRPPGGEAQEAEIEVVVALDPGSPDFDPDVGVRKLWLGCGQLDVLVPGSLWREGVLQGRSPAQRIVANLEFAGDEELGTAIHPQPRGRRAFPTSGIAAAPGCLFRQFIADGGRVPQGEPKRIFVSWMEILRALFGVGNGFLLQLFDGIRDPLVAGGRGLIDRKSSRLEDDGTVRLTSDRILSRDEALITAAVVADERVRGLHDSVFQKLSVGAEWKRGLPRHLCLHWPWEEPLPLDLEGRWMTRIGGRGRFVVSRILAIGVPLSFDRVEVHHSGAERGSEVEPPPSEERQKGGNARVVVLTVRRAASPSRRPVKVSTASVRLSAAAGIEVVHKARGGRAGGDRGMIGEEPRHEAPFGTGGRQPGADRDVGAAVTKRRAGEGEVPDRTRIEAIDATWNALVSACASEGWTLHALPGSFQPHRGMPRGGLDFDRDPLMAMVATAAGCVLVVDRGSELGDECSLGLLIPKSWGPDDRALGVAARNACAAVNGRWLSPKVRKIGFAPEFHLKGVSRDLAVWTDPEAYADLLRRRIASVFRP